MAGNSSLMKLNRVQRGVYMYVSLAKADPVALKRRSPIAEI